MRIQKFQAADMRDAIVQVKRALGPDAVIVATRDVRRGILGSGVEVTAAVDNGEPEPARTLAPQPQASQPGMAEADVERIMLPIRSELRTLRTLLKPVLGQRTDDLRAEIEALRKDFAARFAGAAGAAPINIDEALRAPNLYAASTARVIALVGPTGVGKTTSIAKLAARAALVEQLQVAIITLDSYRVGGEEQMRAFADLMGVPLHVISTPRDLAERLGELKRMDRVFIDTAGRSPRDATAIAEMEQALALTSGVEVHLAMPGGLPLATLESIHRCYRRLAPARLLFTKLDEADDLSGMMQAPTRLGVPVAHVTTGQRVPEDIEDATPSKLRELAARCATTSAEVAA